MMKMMRSVDYLYPLIFNFSTYTYKVKAINSKYIVKKHENISVIHVSLVLTMMNTKYW